jgi:hypothetical protein
MLKLFLRNKICIFKSHLQLQLLQSHISCKVKMNVKLCAHKQSIWCAVHSLTAWGSTCTRWHKFALKHYVQTWHWAPTSRYLLCTGRFVIHTLSNWGEGEGKKRKGKKDIQLCQVSNLRDLWIFYVHFFLPVFQRVKYFNYHMALECQKIMARHRSLQMPEEILLQKLSGYH